MFDKSEYGKGRPERSILRYRFFCAGTENKLSDCVGDSSVSCSSWSEIVAIQCTNTGWYFEPFKNKISHLIYNCMLILFCLLLNIIRIKCYTHICTSVLLSRILFPLNNYALPQQIIESYTKCHRP